MKKGLNVVQGRFPEVVLGVCVVGFIFLLAELVSYQHYSKGTQIVGFVSTCVGLVLSLLAFSRAHTVRRVVLGLLALVAVTGVFGIIEHRQARAEDAVRAAARQATQATASTGSTASTGTSSTGTASTATTPAAGADAGGPPAGGPSDIPVLAPLSLSGLATLTILAMLARRGEGVAEDRVTRSETVTFSTD